MSGLLPSEPEVDGTGGEGEPRVVGVDSEDADRLLAALSSDTGRSLLAHVHEEPATPSELADRVGTSLQNVQYHLGKLRDADLIEVRGTQYSEKGREMNVYGPTDRPLVLFAGSEDQTEGVKTALTRTLGAVGVLGLASLVVQQVFGGGVAPPSVEGASGSGDGGAYPAAMTTTESGGASVEATRTAAEATTTAADGQMGVNAVEQATTTAAQSADAVTAAGGAFGLPPGLVFFLGGLLVVAVGAAWWYLDR